jgi:hypothetical protein
MKPTPLKIQLQLPTLILNTKGRRENCVKTQAVTNKPKRRAQLFQKRLPHASQYRSRHHTLIIDVHDLITRDQNTNPIDINPHNNNTLQTKKCG